MPARLPNTRAISPLWKPRTRRVALALSGGDPRPPACDIDLIRKDLRTMVEAAAARGNTLPVAPWGWRGASKKRFFPPSNPALTSLAS